MNKVFFKKFQLKMIYYICLAYDLLVLVEKIEKVLIQLLIDWIRT